MTTEVFAHGNDLPSDRLGSVLEEVLQAASPTALGIASAYVSIYGTDFVKKQRHSLEIADVRLVCDISDAITHPKALQSAIDDGWDVRVYEPQTGTFHPKLLLGGGSFDDAGAVSDPVVVVIGSSNLTYGGLVRNYECNLVATAPDCPLSASQKFAEFWAGGQSVDQDLLDAYEKNFAKKNRSRSPKDLWTLGIADSGLDPETDPAALRDQRVPGNDDRTFSTASAEAAWAGLESFTGEYTLQVEFPRDAGLVLLKLAGGEASEVISILCADGEIRQIRYRYYQDNGMFRINIPNDTPGVDWARENHAGIAVLWATSDANTPLEFKILPPGDAASAVIGRSVALGTWGKTPTRLYGWY